MRTGCRLEKERLTKLLVEQVEENQARAVELAELHKELAQLRDWQADLAHVTASASQRRFVCGGHTILWDNGAGEEETGSCGRRSPDDASEDGWKQRASRGQGTAWTHDAVSDREIVSVDRGGAQLGSGGWRRDRRWRDGGPGSRHGHSREISGGPGSPPPAWISDASCSAGLKQGSGVDRREAEVRGRTGIRGVDRREAEEAANSEARARAGRLGTRSGKEHRQDGVEVDVKEEPLRCCAWC